MKLKMLSENCLTCYCRTCKNSYIFDNEYFACVTWCETSCKGKTTEVPEKEGCYKPIEK